MGYNDFKFTPLKQSSITTYESPKSDTPIFDSLQSEKSISEEERSSFQSSDNGKIKSINSQCRIIFYKWLIDDSIEIERRLANKEIKDSFESATSISELTTSQAYDISSKLTSFTYNKSMGNPSGSFTFTLGNHLGLSSGESDWKEFIKPGSWCVVYLSQSESLDIKSQIEMVDKSDLPDKSFIRCIGYIERIAVKSELNSKGGFDLNIEVSGRDLGIVYEETEIWQDFFYQDKTLLDILASSNLKATSDTPINEVIKTIHDLIYAPNRLIKNLTSGSSNYLSASISKDGKLNSLSSIGLQWLLPRKLLSDLELLDSENESYFGYIKGLLNNIQPTTANMPFNSPISFLTGNAWQKLKDVSIPQFHELFFELDMQGNPRLNFRLIPWGNDTKYYPQTGKYMTLFQKLFHVNVPRIDVLNFDIGQDNHNRKNHFNVNIINSMINRETNIEIKQGTAFPYQEVDSVRRHGFRPMHVNVNSLSMKSVLSGGTANKYLLNEFDYLLLDLWKFGVNFESGTLERIGSNQVKLGINVRFNNDIPYVGEKLFYIEGYSDRFTIEDNGSSLWTQTINLTHGLVDYTTPRNEDSDIRPENFEGHFISKGE